MTFIAQVPENRDMFEEPKSHFWPADAFFTYRPQTLDACIKKFPLTPDAITKILERSTVKFDDIGSQCFPDRMPMNWMILVDNQAEQERQRLEFLHEIGHIYYRTQGAGSAPREYGGTLTEGGRIEFMLDDAAAECYRTHKEFVDNLVGQLQQPPSPQIEESEKQPQASQH